MLLGSIHVMAQDSSFSGLVNSMFFGADLSLPADSLLAAFKKLPELKYKGGSARQWNLNITVEMKSKNAYSSNHTFLFSKSPVLKVPIKEGQIFYMIGYGDSIQKKMNLHTRITFNNEKEARDYFKRLKLLFDKVSTHKKVEEAEDEDSEEMILYSSRKEGKGVKDVAFGLLKDEKSKLYTLMFILGNGIR
jgi:hypothetical protein